MRVANFVERQGEVASLKVIEPKDFPWPNVSALYWLEVDHVSGQISEETWKGLVKDHNQDYTCK